jgi:predicted nuclease of predicted toxin-antitoxin system
VDCQRVLDHDMGDATDCNARSAKTRLIWVRLGNCRTKALLAAFENVWPRIEAGLNAGDRIIELR